LETLGPPTAAIFLFFEEKTKSISGFVGFKLRSQQAVSYAVLGKVKNQFCRRSKSFEFYK